jgi:hypothetical protein
MILTPDAIFELQDDSFEVGFRSAAAGFRPNRAALAGKEANKKNNLGNKNHFCLFFEKMFFLLEVFEETIEINSRARAWGQCYKTVSICNLRMFVIN